MSILTTILFVVVLLASQASSLNSNIQSTRKSYACYQSENGVTEPVLTIIGTNGGSLNQKVLEFIRQNRVNYAVRWGYRYCELSSVADINRKWSWQRFLLILAVLPCSDYAVFIDGDAVIANTNYSFSPWMDKMQQLNLDILLNNDYIRNSPVQFGVFMVRNTQWVYQHFQQLYNVCVCDWQRMNDWPREQGLIYDFEELLRRVQGGRQKVNSMIISHDKWNEQQNVSDPKLTFDQFIVHYAGCCFNKERQRYDFGSRWFVMLKNYQDLHGNVSSNVSYVSKIDQCVPIYSKSMIHTENYYTDGIPYKLTDQSVINLHINPQGRLSSIYIQAVICPHAPHIDCVVPKFWRRDGRMKTDEEILAEYPDFDNIVNIFSKSR